VLGQPDEQASLRDTVPDPGEHRVTSKPELTLYGQAIGTPAYMAPEQAAGDLDLIDHRTDIYGLGAVLYEILTGHPPFGGASTNEILKKVQDDEVIPPRRLCAFVPPALEAVCLRALAKARADRYSSAAELAREVQNWQEIERRQAEEALRASETLYHSLVETIPMNVWRKDAEGRFTFGNRGFCETTKVPLSELIGKNDFDLFPAELAKKYRRDDRHVLETGETMVIMEEHLTSHGERLQVRTIKLPVLDGHGRRVGTQGIFWDVGR
jgi:PAS domain S-box-containing protein